MMDFETVLPMVGILVALTNIVVQVLKKVTWDRLPTNIVALIVAEGLTVGAGVAGLMTGGDEIHWYTVLALAVAGFAVAYAAMFGYDELRQVLDWTGGDEDPEDTDAWYGYGTEDVDTETPVGFDEPEIVTEELLQKMTKAELKVFMDAWGIAYTTKMTKAELIEAVVAAVWSTPSAGGGT